MFGYWSVMFDWTWEQKNTYKNIQHRSQAKHRRIARRRSK